LAIAANQAVPLRRQNKRVGRDQLAEVVDAVGDRIDVMMDGGIQRGTHVVKALSLGAKAVGLGRFYLFPLAAGDSPVSSRRSD
jgi:L-lactate dehydrogenase (cytochrome)